MKGSRMTTTASPTARLLSAHTMITALGNGRAEIFMAPAFITPAGCERLVDLIERQRQPSTVADSNGDERFRTSETCHMDSGHPVVSQVRTMIAALLGLPIAHAEPLQGQRYGLGGEFKQHCDWFRPDSPDYDTYCTAPGCGQRTWTAMAYLDSVEGGGHTLFPLLGIDMEPKAGTLLMWNNLNPDGSGNAATAHHATPVTRGVKNVITSWFREKPWPTA